MYSFSLHITLGGFWRGTSEKERNDREVFGKGEKGGGEKNCGGTCMKKKSLHLCRDFERRVKKLI